MAYTDIERSILGMWPKFEDGAYVVYEDEFDFGGEVKTAYGFNFGVGGRVSICSDKGSHVRLPNGERVKRPAHKVLDADGVEIKVGDTVWVDGVSESCEVVKVENGIVQVQYADGDTFECCSSDLTHEQPDSWERLEGDAEKSTCEYFGFRDKECSECPGLKGGVKGCGVIKMRDLVRRAKAIAEKEAER